MIGASTRLVGSRYPIGEIMFFRAFFTWIPLMSWLVIDENLEGPQTSISGAM